MSFTQQQHLVIESLGSFLDDIEFTSSGSPIAALFGDKVLDDETAYVQELAMKNLSGEMRQHMMQLQTSLLSEVGAVLSAYTNEVVPIVRVCVLIGDLQEFANNVRLRFPHRNVQLTKGKLWRAL